MPSLSPSSVRMRKFIEQLKLKGLYDEYKLKNKEAAKRKRQKKIEQNYNLPVRACFKKFDEDRQKIKERVRKHRKKKNDQRTNSSVKSAEKKQIKILEQTKNRVRKHRENRMAALEGASTNIAYNSDAALKNLLLELAAHYRKTKSRSN